MLKIIQHQVLYGEERFHAAFPSIARFSDGRLLLAFRRARDANWLIPEAALESLDTLNRMDHIDSRSHIRLLELDAEGKATDAVDMLPMDPEAGDQDPSLLILPDQKVFLASFSWYPIPAAAARHIPGRVPPGDDYPGCRFLFWGAHTSLRNRQSGDWLDDHRYIQPDGGFGDCIGHNKSKAITGSVRGQPLYRDGKIYIALYAGKKREAVLFVSADLGDSWRYQSTIACDEQGEIAFQEPALCSDGKGGFICFMRTAGADGCLASSYSTDGKKWSDYTIHSLWGHPFHPLLLKDGRLLLTYGHRREAYGVRARLLQTASQNPDECEEFIIRDDGLNTDVGYPWAVEMENGKVLVVYYMTDKTGMRYIAGSWLETEAT